MIAPRFREREFRLFCEFIRERCGLNLSATKSELLALKLAARLASLGLADFNAYLEHLQHGPDARRELERIIPLITNHESWFMRDQAQLETFAALLERARVRRLAEGERRVRVLSAGCATGEEVYSLAIIAAETGNFFFNWDFKVVGMDLDREALERARAGVFFERSFRGTDPAFAERNFIPHGPGREVKAGLKKLVEFITGNLLEPGDWAWPAQHDIIFCRNVLIYFPREKAAAAIDNLHRALRPGGWLVLGHSEPLTDRRFAPEQLGRAVAHRKVGGP